MTTLNDFLKQKAFKQYKNGIERIEKDFISSGYEKFLWKPSLEEFDCMRATSAKTKDYEHTPYQFVLDFMKQFESDGIVYMFPKRNEATFFIIQEVCKKARGVYVINNLFPEDDTVNYIAIFDREDIDNIILMNHLAYFGYMSDVFGGYKLFNNSLSYYAEFCADGDQQYMLKRPNDIMHFMNFQTRRDTNPYIIYEVRKKIEGIVKDYYQNEFEFYMDLNYTLMPFLQKLYNEGIEIEKNAPAFDWKSKKEEIKNYLVVRGVINSKWKNEQSLYLLVQKQHSDACYQYRPNWLVPQSLDIYIPSLNVAIEYQGIQHYEAVDFFGGQEGFNNRVRLDNKKRQLCSENGVRLIEWNYNYDISEENLEKMLFTESVLQ